MGVELRILVVICCGGCKLGGLTTSLVLSRDSEGPMLKRPDSNMKRFQRPSTEFNQSLSPSVALDPQT